MDELDIFRKQIDDIDNEILKLLNKRMKSVEAIGKAKQTSGTSIYRPEREKEILDRLKTLNDGMLNSNAIDAIYLEVFAVSRNLEMPEKIVFLGPEGSYTHQVAESRFGAMGNYIALNSVEAVFNVLQNKEAKYGVVPIENNTEGAVGITLDCLGKFESLIVAEIYMDIHHSFATNCENLKDIKKIYSHPQGYNQCRKFLEEHMLMDVEFIPTKSTAASAKLAASEPNCASICSHIAAKLYNVPILFEKIEDNLANKTRFLILSDFKNKAGLQNKTSILAKTQNRPGGLVKFLQSFENEKVNITKIESRPVKKSGFEAVFYLDFEGHIDDENVQKVLKANEGINEIKWLGSYVKAGE
ncbi:prephenate dehydratase [Sulfurospirillum arcachonense]|uniref:prephenate dehydratase n=1 Tax=Sulfurospirillum arcachonense TaxID=57666 RepID=UPI00046A7F57|nr:prephenate dehydratase [Sulfurospirillum arcachonense]